jgi:predicted metal-dependent peptidase
MPPDPELARLVSAALVRLGARSPFFAALALFARWEASQRVPTASTDGRDLFLNPEFFQALTPAEQDGLLAHEVLHAALLHVPRRRRRDRQLWNVAADIVVNGMLAAEGYALPEGGLRDSKLEHLSVEEVYELLEPQAQRWQLPAGAADLLDERPDEAQAGPGAAAGDQPGPGRPGALEKYWEAAQRQARMALEATVHGQLPAHLAREFGQAQAPQLDWRSYLWRFLVQTPTDFAGFDRRFVGQRLYLETLTGESVRVHVCVDTSGSIRAAHLQVFVNEVQAILSAYPHIRCDLYYADSQLHGPYTLAAHGVVPPAEGGGGTDFRPFFHQVASQQDTWTPTLAVYLTDGFGPFPPQPPAFPVLWVVTPGGRALEQFPFGEAVRLLRED